MTYPSKGPDTTLYCGASSFTGCYMLRLDDLLTGESYIVFRRLFDRQIIYKQFRTMDDRESKWPGVCVSSRQGTPFSAGEAYPLAIRIPGVHEKGEAQCRLI